MVILSQVLFTSLKALFKWSSDFKNTIDIHYECAKILLIDRYNFIKGKMIKEKKSRDHKYGGSNTTSKSFLCSSMPVFVIRIPNNQRKFQS